MIRAGVQLSKPRNHERVELLKAKCDVRGRATVDSFVDASMCLHLMIQLDIPGLEQKIDNEFGSWIEI